MHGSLRFILATCVALSHLGITFKGYNIGVTSVVIFYLLAGMVASQQLSTYFVNKPIHYYKNRIRRIFPFYFFALFITLIIYTIHIKSYFLSSVPNLMDYIANITIIPLAYYMYSGQDTFTFIPPAWSLGVELQFYLLIPFLLIRKRVLFLVYAGSFFTYIIASIGVINSDFFGYRLLVGVIFIFILGVIINQSKNSTGTIKKELISIMILSYLVLFILVIYLLLNSYQVPYNHETLMALIIGIPFLYFYKSPLPKKLEIYLGNLSYGVFLLHFPALWVVELFGYTHKNLLLILAITLFLSIIGNFLTTKRAV